MSESLKPVKTTVADVVALVEKLAPPVYALPNDPIGLQVGSRSAVVNKVMVALDATPKTVAAASYQNAQLLVTHHPLIFRPLQSISFDDPIGEAVQSLCEHKIALFSAHTNLDIAPGGVNDALAEALELIEVRQLGGEITPHQYKIVTFIPEGNASRLIDEMAAVGAGVVGEYKRCAFSQQGTGTFEAPPDSHPHIGHAGKRESVSELRIEMAVDEIHLNDAIETLKRVHPYEEPPFDVYPLKPMSQMGIGRIGRLPNPIQLSEFAKIVGKVLDYEPIRYWGADQTLIRCVAVVGGSGGDYLAQAKHAGVDVLVTGETRHHHTWEAIARKIALIDAGHGPTEMPGVKKLADYLKEHLEPRQVTVELI